jgi:hypothetical protein
MSCDHDAYPLAWRFLDKMKPRQGLSWIRLMNYMVFHAIAFHHHRKVSRIPGSGKRRQKVTNWDILVRGGSVEFVGEGESGSGNENENGDENENENGDENGICDEGRRVRYRKRGHRRTRGLIRSEN